MMEEINMDSYSELSIKNLLSKPLKIVPDYRGPFIKLGAKIPFAEQNVSISTKGVLRGFHYQTKGYKLLTPIHGKIYLVFLDLQEDSETNSEWISMTVGDHNRQTFYIPPYIATVFLSLSDLIIMHYNLELPYNVSEQRIIRFDDDRYNVYWPGDKKSYILSEQDYYADDNLIR